MKEKLRQEMKNAMKAREALRLQTIRGILSAIQYEEMQKKTEDLDEASIIALLKIEAKKRTEAIELMQQGGRTDQVAALQQELKVIEEFLPSQLDETELEKILGDLKSQNPGMQMGLAMKELKDKYFGQYDGKAASQIAKRIFG